MAAFTNVSHAQDENNGQTANGNWLIEMNTGFGNGTAAHTANTGFGLASSDGTTIWSVGGETGYFIDDDLALKLGLGYTDFDGISAFSYKFGAKYYAASIVPVQLDVTGASWKDADENPLWLGIQGGYAIFLGDMVSAEPGIRYNISLNEDFTDEGVLELRFGFVLHL
ncbi:MAG: hypothetical protein HKO56_08525 [Bacteroidia bacterium]|nr:hypothetical protein [Bacteroidia bacterium]NNM16689.1 hypothetical protein [Bacteroidia bacterium]